MVQTVALPIISSDFKINGYIRWRILKSSTFNGVKVGKKKDDYVITLTVYDIYGTDSNSCPVHK